MRVNLAALRGLPGLPSLLARAAERCLAHPGRVLGVTVALVAASLGGASCLVVDPSPEAYLVDTEAWAEFRRLDATFGIGETVVVALREPGGTVFDAETVQTVAEIDRVVGGMTGVKRVLSIASAKMLGNIGDKAQAETIDVGRVLPAGPITNTTAVELGSRISRHPIYRRLLTDDRHETTFLLVQIGLDDPVRRLVLVRQIRTEVDRFESRARKVHLAGTPVTKEAIASGVQEDMVLFFPATLLLLVVLLWIMLGDPLAALIPLGVVGFSTTVVMGLLGVLGIPLNLATATVPTMLLVVGLADSVHFFTELRRRYARTKNREACLVATVEAVALPCLLTSLTAAAGYLALMWSKVEPLREFGVSAAIGLVVGYFASMLLTPVLLSTLRYPRRRVQLEGTPRMAQVLSKMATRAGKKLPLTIAIAGVLTGAGVAAISRIDVDTDFVSYVPSDSRLRRDLAVIEKSFGGADTVEIVIRSEENGAFLDPARLQKVDQLGRELRKLPGVGGLFSFSDFLMLANHTMSGRAWTRDAAFDLPDTREAVAQILLLDSESMQALASADLRQVRVTVQIPARPTETTRALSEQIRATAARVFAGTDVQVTVTGLPTMFSEMVRQLVTDSAASFGWAALLVWIAMMVGFRSVPLASAAILPVVLPVGLTFAAMAMLGLPLDINGAFVACLGVGISVDNAIHIVARYQRARAHGSPTPGLALRYALTHAGQPVLLTSVLLGLSFVVLCLSSFQPTVKVGVMGCLLVALALVADLLLLPVLLIAADRVGAAFEPEARAMPSEISGRFRDAASTLTQDRSSDPPPPEDGDGGTKPPGRFGGLL